LKREDSTSLTGKYFAPRFVLDGNAGRACPNTKRRARAFQL